MTKTTTPDNAPATPVTETPVVPAPATPPATPEPAKQEPVTNEPVKQEPVKSEPTPEPDATQEFDGDLWGSTGEEVTDSVLMVLHEGGATPEDAKALLWDAVQAGDPSKVDKEALIEKVGKARANLIMTGIKSVTDTNNAKNEAAIAEVHKAAGGKETWEKIVPWITAEGNVPDADMADYRGMIDKGGKQAAFAVAELKSLYNADPKNTTIGNTTTVDGEAVTTPALEGLSQREYGDLLLQGRRKGMTGAERDQLQARRRIGRAKGM